MKRICTVMLVMTLLLTVSSTSAQGITGGLKAGMNIANFHGDAVESSIMDPKMGFCAGGFIVLGVANIIAIQPEILYTQKGVKSEDQYGEGALNFNYLEMPVLVKVTIPVQSMVKPYLCVGPYFSYNITAKVVIEYNGYSDEQDLDEDVKDTDFGTVFGGGMDFCLPVGKIVFDARYSLGLTSIDEPNGEQEDVKNNAFSFTFGYAL